MTDMTKTDKKCPHCGAPLAQDASFCPHCTATLAQRRVIALPRAGHRRSRWLLLAAVIAAAAAVVLWLSRPGGTPPEDTADKEDAVQAAADPYLAACQTYYTGADGREYHVFTAVTPSIEGRTDPVGYRSELIPAGGTVDFPATVMVEDAVTQDYAAEDFAALLDSWDVSVTAPEGVSRVKLWDAEEETPESPALLYRRLRADPTCTHNEVVWTLRMKSGDVLHLTMTVEFEEQQALRITPEDAPLETTQELQALLDRLAEEYNADTSITVELPDVTYGAPVSVGCAVTLKGSGTAFAAPVTVTPLRPLFGGQLRGRRRRNWRDRQSAHLSGELPRDRLGRGRAGRERRLGLSPRRVYRRQRGGRAVRLRVQQLLYIYHQAH